jgi:hypothetical protein
MVVILASKNIAVASPPFYTDDPEPVEWKHWEYYIATINNHADKTWSGTLPHLEVNYGVIENVQLHLLLPMNYSYADGNVNMGYSSTEVGIKYRFVQETEIMPQIGVFPIVELPTIGNTAFGNDKTQLYLPVWGQKSWGKFTSYGGGGYWINPGDGNKNWLFTGWEAQYNVLPVLTLGGEIYFHTASDEASSASMGFNGGGMVNFTDKFHLLFSLGSNLTSESFFSSYLAVQWTL